MARTDLGTTSERAPGGQLAQIPRAARHYLSTEAGSAGFLLAAAIIAVIWANSPWSHSYESLWETTAGVSVGSAGMEHDLHFWVNDGLMVLFFLVVGLEVRRELSMGELTDRRRIVVPLSAALCGILVPAAIYLAINPSGDAAAGWGTVIGTDTAFMLGAVALLGPKCPSQLRVFLLTLTVFDDIVAVSIIGVVYSENIDLPGLFVALVAVLLLVLFDRLGVWQTWPYSVVVLVLWLATVRAGLHPSIAGMVAGLLIPAFSPRRSDVDRAIDQFRAFRQSPMPDVGYAATTTLQRAVSVNERMQLRLHPWTSYLIVPIFALANAGVDLRNGVLQDALQSPVTWGVVAGLVIGKLVGVGAGALGAVRMRWGQLPEGVSPSQVWGGAAMSGMGFTVSLLIIGLAFDSDELRREATVGVLLAAVFAALVGGLIFVVSSRVFGHRYATLPVTLDRPLDPERDHIRGNVDAPYTLVEYGDFECPFCGRATGMLRDLREEFAGELRYVFRHLPLVEPHPHAELAAQAAEAASLQGKFWEMHDLLFAHQDDLTTDDLIGYAAELDLDIEKFIADLRSPDVERRVLEDARSADASGAHGTPTFFVGDRRHIGAYDATSLADELRSSGGRASK